MFASCNCEEQLRKAVTGGRNEALDRSLEDVGESSQPSEEEPNDSAEQATSIRLGSERRPVKGSIAGGDDVDWYTVRATEGEEWLITMEVEPLGNLDARVDLELSSDSDKRVTYDTSQEGEIESVQNLGVDDEVLRFSVRSADGSAGDYRLVFKKQLTGGAVEREPNDDRETATTFEFPGESQGFYDRQGDRDWFHASGENVEPGIYRLSVTPTGEFPHRLKMYTGREAEEAYLSVQAPPKEPVELPNLRVPEEIGGLWLSMQAGKDNYSQKAGYRVRAVPHPSESKFAIEGEPNDSAGQAVGMRLGDIVRGYLHEPGDQDQFRIAIDRELPGEMDTADEADVDQAEPPPDTGTREPKDVGEEPDADAGEPAPVYVPPLERISDKESPEHVVQVGLRPLADTDRLALTQFTESGGGASTRRSVAADNRGESVKLCNVPVDQGLMRIGVRGEHVEERRVRDTYTYELTAVDVLDEVEGLEIEPNDSRERADAVPFGESRTAFISEAGDRDVFAFGIPDPKGQERLERQRVEAPPPAAREQAPSAARDVESDTSDAGEPTDATDVGQGQQQMEELPPPEPQSVEISLEANRLDLSFAVLDEQGGLIAEVDHAGPGGDESTSIDLPPGLYFVEVESARDFECRPYKIEMSKN
jgi:hypothetical protein